MALTLSFQKISFTYPQSPAQLLNDISFDLYSGWCGLSGANGAGKTTLLLLAAGSLTPLSGYIRSPLACFCPQKTDEKPPEEEEYLEALYSGDNRAGRLFSLLKLDHDWPYRWDTLSHGERKRFQLAAALWLDRELLIVDEPTNHLDDSSRNLILASLKEYRGIGLIVSHDRTFMDSLCTKNLFLRNGSVKLRPGSLSSGLEQEVLERETLMKQREQARKEIKRLEKEAASRRQLAENQQKRRSKKGLDIKDHDSRFKKNLARVTGKDGTGGKLLRQMDGRLSQAHGAMDSLDNPDFRKTGVTQHGGIYRGDRLVRLEEGSLPLGEKKELFYPALEIKGTSRIALTGDNGTGKSTLIGRLLHDMSDNQKILYIPQEPPRELLNEYRHRLDMMNPEDKGTLVSYFSRLGGDPDSLLSSEHLSPGEWRKLMTAFGLTEEPILIILDEPTNHLDMGSISSLESTLAETSCALLLVSHDRRLRETLTSEIWHLEEEKKTEGPKKVTLCIQKP